MGSDSFRTETRSDPEMPGVSIFQLAGDVSYRNAPQLRRQLMASISTGQGGQVVIELSGVDDMDTAGAAVLVESMVIARQRGKEVLYCSPSEAVLRIFRLAGLGEALERCCSGPDETRQRLEAAASR